MSIGELLAAARNEHLLYRQNVPHKRAGGGGVLKTMVGDADQSLVHLKEALRLRLEAEAQDPKHLDPAWNEDVNARFRQADVINWYQDRIANGADAGEARRQENIARINGQA